MATWGLLTLLVLSRAVALPSKGRSTSATIKPNIYSNHFGVPGVNETFDYVVVGGGNAGLVVATRLAEDPSVSVAVIEAGGFYEDSGNTTDVPSYAIRFDGMAPSTATALPTLDWGIVTTPQAGLYNKTFHYSRGKTLGGCTALNGMIYHRATNQSYEQWASAVGDDSYMFEKFLPYYTKSVNFTFPNNNLRPQNASIPDVQPMAYSNTGGPLHTSYTIDASPFNTWAEVMMTEAGLPVAQDFLSGALNGVQNAPGTINPDRYTRDTSQTSFLNSQFATGNSNLKVYINTMATKILFNDDKQAIGASVETAGSTYQLHANREVILSAGAFMSPQLLMVSGIGPQAELDKFQIPVIADRPGVGQNLQDQPLFGIAHAVGLSGLLSNIFYVPGATDAAVNEYLTNATGPLTRYISYLGWEKLPDRSNFSSDNAADLAKFPADWPEVEYLALNDPINAGSNVSLTYVSIAVSLMTPTSRGTVTLSSGDAKDLPIVDPQWLAASTDRALAVAAFRRLRQFWETSRVQTILIGDQLPTREAVDTDEEILEYISENFSTIWHAASTCKMGLANDTMAVVDSQAKVIGVTGLSVVDASAFPFLPPGHPMATVYALAEKIADDIKTGR